MTADFKLGTIDANYRTKYTQRDGKKYLEGYSLGQLFPNGTENLDPNSEEGKLVGDCLKNTDCADGFKNAQQQEKIYQARHEQEQARLKALGVSN